MISTLLDRFIDASSRKEKGKSRSKRLGMGYPLTVSLSPSINIDGSMNGKIENVGNAAKEDLLPRMWL